MITRETDYAIRALLRLALQGEGGVVSTSVLAEEMEIPYRFLRRILLKLGEQGLVHSTRGKQGGLYLAIPPEQINLLDIVRAVDPQSVTLNICLADDEHACPRQEYCVVHDELDIIQVELHRRFADISLAKLVERDRKRLARI